LELQKLEKRNGKFIKPLPAQREIEDILSLETNEQYIIEWKYQTATEFQENWDKQLRKYSSQQVGVVLNLLGCDAQKVYKDGIQRRLRKLPVLTWRSRISTTETEIEEEVI